MNHCAKFDAASFILGGEIRNHTNTKNKQTNRKTITNISTPFLSACVDNKKPNNTNDNIGRLKYQ